MPPLLRQTAIALLVLLPALQAAAQAQVTPLSKEAREPANYAFANYLGTGFYRTSGQDVAVINIPMTFEPEEQGEVIYRWRLAPSVGFFDFDFDNDEIGENIPSSADTIAVIPGVEFDFPVGDNTTVVPYFDLGWSKNFTSHEDVAIYSVGVSSMHRFRARNKEHLWVNRLIYAGYRTQSANVTDSFASLQTGVDWKTPLRWGPSGRGSYTSIYGIAYWYFDQVSFRRPDEEKDKVSSSYELGATYGFDKPIDLYLFELERVGFGYRWSDDLDVWRLTFNLPI